jgi:hypothetical protein
VQRETAQLRSASWVLRLMRAAVTRVLESWPRAIGGLLGLSVGQYLLRVALTYPVAQQERGFNVHSLQSAVIQLVALTLLVIGGVANIVAVLLSVTGLAYRIACGRRMPTAFGSPVGAVVAIGVVGITTMVFGLAVPEAAAARMLARGMSPLVIAIKKTCATAKQCPSTLRGMTLPTGVRALSGAGWEYRACSGETFAVFVGACWLSDCQMLTWRQGSCCVGRPSTVLDDGWSIELGEESEQWIDRLCGSQ